MRLRTRLTLIRLAWIRKPWACGVRVSRPHCRYSCLHLRFRALHRPSRDGFCAARNAPLPMLFASRGFGCGLHARSSSMRDRSTSELLRTLQMNSCFQANILAVSADPPRSDDLARYWGPWPALRALSLSPPDISTRRLTPGKRAAGIRSSSGVDRR